jgi:hypothetical protein
LSKHCATPAHREDDSGILKLQGQPDARPGSRQ